MVKQASMNNLLAATINLYFITIFKGFVMQLNMVKQAAMNNLLAATINLYFITIFKGFVMVSSFVQLHICECFQSIYICMER